MFKQPTKDKALIVAALRSGKYTQGAEVLKREEEGRPTLHCCLGVAQEVLSGEVESEGKRAITGGPDYLLMPSPDWCERRHISNRAFPIVPAEFVREDFCNLTAPMLNDSGEFTFSQIADLWEYFVEGV